MSGKKTPFLDIDEVTAENVILNDQEENPKEPKRRVSPAVGLGTKEKRSLSITDVLDQHKDEIKRLTDRLEKGEGKEALKLKMPVSGMEVSFELHRIKWDLIDVSEENQRDQSLLDKAALDDIYPSMQKEGQQHPGTVRPRPGGRYELIEGSRRLACCRYLERTYLAWVGNVPDSDVRALSRIENKHNQISLYEKSRSYARDIENALYTSWEQLAAAEGFSSRTATRYKRMAELDKLIVRAFPNPTELTVTIADWITQKIQTNDTYKAKLLDCATELVAEREERITCGLELLSATEISSRFKKAIRVKSQQPTKKEPVTYANSSGKVKLKHSISTNGTPKLEFIGVTDRKMEQILEVIMKSLDLESIG